MAYIEKRMEIMRLSVEFTDLVNSASEQHQSMREGGDSVFHAPQSPESWLAAFKTYRKDQDRLLHTLEKAALVAQKIASIGKT